MYVLHSGGTFSREDVLGSLDAVFGLFEPMDNAPSDCRLAYESGMKDYEDALIAHAAHRHGIDLIVTRDKKGFAASPVPAMTPTEFLRAYQPDGVEYDLVDF